MKRCIEIRKDNYAELSKVLKIRKLLKKRIVSFETMYRILKRYTIYTFL